MPSIASILGIVVLAAATATFAQPGLAQSLPDRTRIVPLIRPLDYVPEAHALRRENIAAMTGFDAEMDGQAVPAERLPLLDTFVGDLHIRYAVDDPHVMFNVSPSGLKALAMSRQHLRSLANENLARLYAGRMVERAKPGAAMLVNSGELESSWLLVREFWMAEAARVRGEVVAAVPARDVLLFADSGVAGAIDALQGDSEKRYASAGRAAVSRLLFVWRDGAWEVYENQPTSQR